MSDLISRQAAIDALGEKPLAWTEDEYELGLQNQWQSDVDALKALPAVQPQRKTDEWCTDCREYDKKRHCCPRFNRVIRKTLSEQTETHDKRTKTHACDLIDRRKVIYKLTTLVNEVEEIFADIREREVDDSVCVLCEYDGAYIGQSGDWCNECPGFDRNDCFKLKEEYREEWLKIDG